MADFKLMDTLRIMKEQVKDCSDNIFATDRPKSVPEKMNDFIVVGLPVMIYNKMVGEGWDMHSTYVRYEIYVKDVRGIENTKKLTDIAQSILDTFPVKQSGVLINQPRVVMKGTDGHGFHSAWIQASLLTY